MIGIGLAIMPAVAGTARLFSPLVFTIAGAYPSGVATTAHAPELSEHDESRNRSGAVDPSWLISAIQMRFSALCKALLPMLLFMAAQHDLVYAASRPMPSLVERTWFSVPLELRGLPQRHTGPIPVSCEVDFTALADGLNAPGLVDERSLRLVRIHGRREVEEPFQFTPAPQQHLRTAGLLQGTQRGVSYTTEIPAGITPAGVHVAGKLTWLVSEGRRYRVDFGILRTGREVQVPYPPFNFRSLDSAGEAVPPRWFSRMQVRPQQPLGGKIDVLDGGEVITSCYTGPTAVQLACGNFPFKRPFLYPVNAPGGIALTSFGKPHDPTGSHAHHYSLWIAHAQIQDHDFWSERGPGLIVHNRFRELEDGPVFCNVAQDTVWQSGGQSILNEQRQFTFYSGNERSRLVDVELELTPAASTPVTLGKTSFGFLAVRVAQSLAPFDGGGLILNARGDRNEAGAHLRHAEWLDISGHVTSEKTAGVAILDYPRNANHPTAWHCRNDGWAGASFTADKEYLLAPGTALRLRYRLVLHTGNAQQAQIAARFSEYAAQPQVVFGEPTRKR